MEYKLFLDTNALLNLQENAFLEEFVIAQKTLEEIEKIKTAANKDAEVKYKARNIARLLDKNYGKYVVVPYSKPVIDYILKEFGLTESPDNIILASAYYYNAFTNMILLVSDDVNVRFLSREVFKLPTRSSGEINLINNQEVYRGFKSLILSNNEMSDFYTHISDNLYGLLPNQYLIIKTPNGEIVDTLKWTNSDYKKVCNKTLKSSLFDDKIKPKDVYQACAIDSILSNTITAISGKAGSGKSLLSLASIMYLIDSGKYDRAVIMFNPTKAKGASDMGYYSGSATEKAMQNSIGAMLTTKFGDRYAVDMLLQQEKIKLISMADIRGMEIRDNEILYIPECQNTSTELLKLCLSRASKDCKIVLEGDFKTQVDSYLFDGCNNGMVRAIEVLKGEPEFGYVELQQVWRSRIAELADKF